MLDQNTYRLKDVLRSKIRKWCKRPMSHKVKRLSNMVGFPESNLAKESQVQKTSTLYVCRKQIYWNFSLKGDVMFIFILRIKGILELPQKKKKKEPQTRTTIWSIISLLGIHQKKMKIFIWTDTCTQCSQQHHSTVTKIWKQPKYLPIGQWIKKTWHTDR